MKNLSFYLSLLIGSVLLSGCVTTEGEFIRLNDVKYDAHFADHPVEVFRGDSVPEREYIEIAILDSKAPTYGVNEGNLELALERLKEQCRLAGGDAIIKIRENKTGHFETTSYHVSARAIKYTN